MSDPAIPHPKEDFDGFQSSLFKALMSASVASNALDGSQIGFHRSLDRQFAKNMDHSASHLLTAANRLLQQCAHDTGVDTMEFEDADDVNNRYINVVEVVDALLEKADICLDEYRGVRKAGTETALAESSEAQPKELERQYKNAGNIVRPQSKFNDINNLNDVPFERKIKTKPHALVPLDHNVTPEMLPHPDTGIPLVSLPHAYEFEIMSLQHPDHMFIQNEPQMYLPFDETKPTWVETEEQLDAMLAKLEKAQEIAVDLEYHDFRSYQGFTCLMQISTRDEDFIVDTLELRNQLYKLNDVFADPAIVKVLHGATFDIQWLQKDFGVYIVNLFDTYFATKQLDFPSHGLAFLLQKYCAVTADKRFQLADWRIRPLPEPMLKYAQSDTHYLLYIYDCLRNELLAKSVANENLLRSVLASSNEVALNKWEKPVYDMKNGEGKNGWANLLRRWNHRMTSQQLAVFKSVHYWRDQAARDEDESPRYILPNHMLFALVERMPIDKAGVIGCCNPCPTYVLLNAQMLAARIQRAKMDALAADLEAADTPVMTKRPAEDTTEQDRTQATLKRHKVDAVDPAVFDLQKAKEARMAQAAQVSKASSQLFGSWEDATEVPGAHDKLERIRASMKLTMPYEGLAVKSITTAKDLRGKS